MSKSKYLLLVMVLLLLTMQSCLVIKDYKKPTPTTTDLYNSVNNDSISLANMPWEKLFKEELLQRYIQKGLKYNYDMRIAIKNILSYEAYLKQAKHGYMPTFQLNAKASHIDYSKSTPFSRLATNINQYEISGTLSWEADIWGKITANKRVYFAQYLKSKAMAQAVRTKLISNIAILYYQLVTYDSQLEAVNKTINNRKESIKTIQALLLSGEANATEVKQTEAQLYETKVIVYDLKYHIQRVENALNILLGNPPTTVITREKLYECINVEIKTGIPMVALSHRPDVMASELNFRKNFELTNVARASLYPSLKISPTIGLQSVNDANLFDPSSFFSNILGQLSTPIMSRRKLLTNLDVANINQQKALLQYQQTLLNASKEVSDALLGYQNETIKIKSRKKQFDALNKAAIYSDELLKQGFLDNLAVLTAKKNALDTELELINNKFQQAKNIILLYKALGGGVADVL